MLVSFSTYTSYSLAQLVPPPLSVGSTDHSFGINLQGTLPTAHNNLTLYITPKFVSFPPPQKFSSCASDLKYTSIARRIFISCPKTSYLLVRKLGWQSYQASAVPLCIDPTQYTTCVQIVEMNILVFLTLCIFLSSTNISICMSICIRLSLYLSICLYRKLTTYYMS